MDALPDTHMRRIRNIDFCSQDLESLLRLRKQKLSGTTLDAYAAITQDVAERSSKGRDFVLFSSWIPAIVSGLVQDGGHAGSVHAHVMAACNNEDGADAVRRPRWAIPLCGGNPAHWVLGWVNWAAHEYGIIDSIPELESASWAIPLLRKSLDGVRTTLGMHQIGWKALHSSVRSPPVQERQIDSWSCGLFVMVAIQSFSDNWDTPLLGETAKEDVRIGALRALLNVPPRPPQPVTKRGALSAPQDGGAVSTDSSHQMYNVPSASSMDLVPSKKRCRDDLSDIDLSGDTDNEEAKSRRSDAAKGPRQSRTRPAERAAKLDADPWVRSYTVREVECEGCRSSIRLHKTREFDLTNWNSHRTNCSHITGITRIQITTFKDGKMERRTKEVKATPSVKKYFQPLPRGSRTAASSPPHPSVSTPVVTQPTATVIACTHLRGGIYAEYILRTQTRSLGGVSPTFRGRISRQLFPYKPFAPLLAPGGDQGPGGAVAGPAAVVSKSVLPPDSNRECEERKWTPRERDTLDDSLRGWARWTVDFGRGFVRSTRCDGTTSNKTSICDACEGLALRDAGFKKSLTRKKKESEKPVAEQHQIHAQREKFAPSTFRNGDARDLERKAEDPLIFPLFLALRKEDSTGTFLALYKQAREGKLVNHEIFVTICDVLSKQLDRVHSNKPGALKGMRYSRDYLNFMTVMRSYGQHSSQQYSILSSQIGGPCPRTLQKVIKRSPDVLTKPDLDYENIARVKRLMDLLKYSGPVAVAGDCTKVRQRLTYSNDHGSHVLGSVLPLNECSVETTEDISRLVQRVGEEKQYASQVRAVLIKIPLPHIPPLVVALRPTKGNDDAQGIHQLHMQLLVMAESLGIKVVSMAADGASSEQGAQSLMDHEKSVHPPLTYSYPLYGIRLSAPVLTTGPLIPCQDPPHARKTSRNQPQHGTHTASLGRGVLVNRSLVALQETGIAGLMRRDVENVDKQDDGAARRLFHHVALAATTTKDEGGKTHVRDEFNGLFVYLFIFGELFDAWQNRRLSPHDRILAAFRARLFLMLWHRHIKQMELRFPDLYPPNRAFISPASFNIFNRLCDSLILLILAYSRFYPDQPFCPWLHGTEFVEHFFGLARTLLPDFTYAELLKLVKHVMLRQQILLSGKVNAKKERTIRAGYVLDYDPSPLSASELEDAKVRISEVVLNKLVVVAYQEASQIAKQLLGIPLPKKFPLDHIPLRPPHRSRAPAKRTKPVDDQGESESSASEMSEGEDEDDSDVEPSPTDMATPPCADVETTSQQTADAAFYTARYGALSEDLEDTIEELAAGLETQPPSASDSIPSASACEGHSSTPGEFIGPLPPPSHSHLVAAPVDKCAPSTQQPSTSPPAKPQSLILSDSSPALDIHSRILDSENKVVVQNILDLRCEHQSGTATHSERVVMLDPKFALHRVSKPDAKLSSREGSHYVRVAQDLAAIPEKPKKTAREQRWHEAAKRVQMEISETDLPNLSSKNVSALHPIRVGSFLVMKNDARTYLGEVLDIYKKANRRHGSLEMAPSISGLSYFSLRVYLPLTLVDAPAQELDADEDDAAEDDADTIPFSCRSSSVDIHTHAQAGHLLYHLGTQAASGERHMLTLKPFAAARWRTLTKKKVQEKLYIRIPARKAAVEPTTVAPSL